MGTVNFSVPDEIKESFNETFGDENKSAIVAGLMQQAVDERRRQERRAVAIDAILELRSGQRPASDDEIGEVRKEIRR